MIMDFRKEEITCITCKHFPCFEHDKKAQHTGHLSMDYNLVYDRPFPCSVYKNGLAWEPNDLLLRTKDKRNEEGGIL